MIGIDSLRLDELKRFGGTGLTPNLDRFLEHADVFADSTTPAARTFSSWVAILTGRAPTETGARFNLGARCGRANPTIADVFEMSVITPCSQRTRFASRISMRATASIRS